MFVLNLSVNLFRYAEVAIKQMHCRRSETNDFITVHCKIKKKMPLAYQIAQFLHLTIILV